MTTSENLSQFKPDKNNANKHTKRGSVMIENSLREFGAGRSILVDKNGNIIAGNATYQGSVDVGIEDCIVVPSDGTKLVVVQRTDLDIDDPIAKRLAIADNRISEVNLDWDATVLSEFRDEGSILDDLFRDDEIDSIMTLAMQDSEIEKGISDAVPHDNRKDGMGNTKKQIKPVLYAEDIADFEKAIHLTGEQNRGIALVKICRFYIDNDEKRQFDFK